MVDEGIMKGEPSPEQQEPQDFVVVLAYRSTDGEIEEDFGKLINDVKALYTFKQDVRVYALVEEAAKEALAVVEKPIEPKTSNRVVLSYEASVNDDPAELTRVGNMLNQLFEAYPRLLDKVVIEPSAQALLDRVRSTNG
jgi:hypothetical protein